MTLRLALIFAATALASANSFAQEQTAAPTDSATSESPSPEMKALVESCTAHKFETTVERIVDGKKRGSKVKLCGKEGQTDADWVNTLKDAARKIETNETMAQASKDQIITALNSEISKIEAEIEAASATASALPVAAEPAVASPEYASLPSRSTAPAVATNSPPAKPAPAPRKPRLNIQCSTPGEVGGGGPCIYLERQTLLTIRADEDLASGIRLRFLRRGDGRGELSLAQMRQGQSSRFRLPTELCAGVSSGKVEIQILGPGASGTGVNHIADTLGPYQLRC